MGRQKRRRGATNQVDTAPRSTLTDMLAATAQHSVPILPAESTAGAGASGTRKTVSYARKTLAPFPAARADGSATSTASTPRTSPSASAQRERAATRHTTQRQRTLVPRPSGPIDGDATPATQPQEPPERPTIVLPSSTGTQLPTVASDEQRAVVRREAPAQPALLIRGSSRLPRSYALPLAPRRRGPRPFAAQFLFSMVTVMVLFTTLTLTSPLGRAGAFANAYQAYANAIPFVPTPTPTPTPRPYSAPLGTNPGQQVVINEIVAVFGSYSQGALNVARCESDYDPNARNPYAIGNSHASGVFQILYPSTWYTTSYAAQSPFDYNANIHAAYEIFSRDGHTWSEWACKP